MSADVIREHLPELVAQLSPEEWEWSAIGDNTLVAWNWATSLERDHGVDHQEALRVVRAELVPAGTP